MSRLPNAPATNSRALHRGNAYSGRGALCPVKECAMAKSQKKSNREIRKPKAEKAPKANASNPTAKGKPVEMTTIK